MRYSIRTGHMPLCTIRPNRNAIRAAANEAAHYELQRCRSHGNARIRTLIDYPSMMGYGTDSVTILTCGCSHSDTPLGTL